MIGACYIRVSTDEQTEYSPDAQIHAIKEYCKKNNIMLADEFIFKDEGISGRRADKRPEFMRMIHLAKTKPKPFGVILVHKFDRFARSREDSIVYKSLLKRECGIKVISITETIEDDKFGVILEGMLESMAEYYSLNLADEVKKGLLEKAKRGEVNSKAPFGYKNENKTFVPDENAFIVKLIYEKFVNENLGYRQLAMYLNNLGYKTRYGNDWELRMIKYMLRNPAYCGYTRWCPIRHDTHHYMFDKSIIVKSNFEPIISEELYNQAQEKIEQVENIHRKYAKNTVKKHWLSNLVECAYCGKKLTRSAGNYFQCSGYNKGLCKHSQSISISVLENKVLEQLKYIFEDKIEIFVAKDDKNNNDELSILERQLDKINDKEKRIKEAYKSGIDTLEEYRQNKEQIKSERETLENNINKLNSFDKQKANKRDIIKISKQLYKLLQSDEITVDEKYDIIHLIIEKMVFNRQEKTLAIYFRKDYTKNN
jgi:DNA invertase Pin-like site-specific DNA recombinase/ABC-type phosphate transport system auxiliary subunit